MIMENLRKIKKRLDKPAKVCKYNHVKSLKEAKMHLWAALGTAIEALVVLLFALCGAWLLFQLIKNKRPGGFL